MNCSKCRKNASAYIDQELSSADVTAFERHVALCPDCQKELEGLRRTAAAVRSLGVAPLPPGFRQQVRSALQSQPRETTKNHNPKFGPLPRGIAVAAAAVLIGLLSVGAYYGLARPKNDLFALPQAADLEQASPELFSLQQAPSEDGMTGAGASPDMATALKAPEDAPEESAGLYALDQGGENTARSEGLCSDAGAATQAPLFKSDAARNAVSNAVQPGDLDAILAALNEAAPERITVLSQTGDEILLSLDPAYESNAAQVFEKYGYPLFTEPQSDGSLLIRIIPS